MEPSLQQVDRRASERANGTKAYQSVNGPYVAQNRTRDARLTPPVACPSSLPIANESPSNPLVVERREDMGFIRDGQASGVPLLGRERHTDENA